MPDALAGIIEGVAHEGEGGYLDAAIHRRLSL